MIDDWHKLSPEQKYKVNELCGKNWEGIPLPYKEKVKAWLENNC